MKELLTVRNIITKPLLLKNRPHLILKITNKKTALSTVFLLVIFVFINVFPKEYFKFLPQLQRAFLYLVFLQK